MKKVIDKGKKRPATPSETFLYNGPEEWLEGYRNGTPILVTKWGRVVIAKDGTRFFSKTGTIWVQNGRWTPIPIRK